MEKNIRKGVGLFVDKNLEEILEWDSLNEEQVKHIKDVATSIVFTRDKILNGGGFVTAIVNNDLERAVTCADKTCIKALKLFVLVKLWVN